LAKRIIWDEASGARYLAKDGGAVMVFAHGARAGARDSGPFVGDLDDQLRSGWVSSAAIGGRVLNLQGVREGVGCHAARQADPYVARFEYRTTT
jgi:hypothetical protein